MKRGEIWLVELGQAASGGPRTAQPCVVVSPSETNEHFATVMVAPMTTTSQPAPFRVPVKLLGRKGLMLLEQTRAVEKAQLVRRLGAVSAATLSDALAALQELFAE